jgi:hypothetical protein
MAMRLCVFGGGEGGSKHKHSDTWQPPGPTQQRRVPLPQRHRTHIFSTAGKEGRCVGGVGAGGVCL